MDGRSDVVKRYFGCEVVVPIKDVSSNPVCVVRVLRRCCQGAPVVKSCCLSACLDTAARLSTKRPNTERAAQPTATAAASVMYRHLNQSGATTPSTSKAAQQRKAPEPAHVVCGNFVVLRSVVFVWTINGGARPQLPRAKASSSTRAEPRERIVIDSRHTSTPPQTWQHQQRGVAQAPNQAKKKRRRRSDAFAQLSVLQLHRGLTRTHSCQSHPTRARKGPERVGGARHANVG